MENNNKLQRIIQAGAVGLCILLIGLLGYVFKSWNDFTSNHLQESIKFQQESIKVQQELKTSIDNLSGFIERFINTLDR